MAKFPNCYYSSFRDFHRDYKTHLREAQESVDADAVAHAAHLIEKAIKDDRTIFVCGNGGSSAIANHLEVDFAKGISTNTPLRPKIVSLCRLELITAYGNDHDFRWVFSEQLKRAARPGDLLIVMSASGNSKNVIAAASSLEIETVIGMTGFTGGDLAELLDPNGDVHIHVGGDSENYGIYEGVFEDIMHEIAQFIRQSNIDPDKVKETKF